MEGKSKKLLKLAMKHHGKISFLGYVVGVSWFIALVHSSINNVTYLSENALLPGMVDTLYDFGYSAKNMRNEIRNELNRGNLREWLEQKMTNIGLEVYRQNFTSSSPKHLSFLNQSISGTNIYGILRAPRIARSEALVLMIPWKDDEFGVYNELALMLSLAEHFRNNIYWAKDIIFLIVDQGEIGVQSWLDEYHGVQSKYIKSSRMLARSGAIQAAINVEFEDEDFNYMQIMMESLNGQLPNLDLINMVIRLCVTEGIPVSLKKFSVRHFNDGWDEYRSLLSTMVSMMFNQASCKPSANHGMFPKYGIEAVTLRGMKRFGGNAIRLGRLGRSLEGMFRSLNSLLERFHQSFFFYLLSSTSRYVSIGVYMPPLACIIIGPALSSLSLWFSSVKEQGTTKDDNLETNNEEANEKKEKSSQLAFLHAPRHFLKVFRVIFAGYFVGLFMYLSPLILQYFDVSWLEVKPSQLIITLVLGAFLLGSIVLFTTTSINNLQENDVVLLKSLALVIYICQIGCLATINFSFAFFLSVVTSPFYLFVRFTQNRYRRLLQVIFMFTVSPPSLLFLLTSFYHYFTMGITTLSFSEIVLLSYQDSYLLNTWSYSAVLLAVLPNWITFLVIAFM